jgi:hypothetical protein
MSTQLKQAGRELTTLNVLSEIETSRENLTHRERNAIALVRQWVVERLTEGFEKVSQYEEETHKALKAYQERDPDFHPDVPF